MTGPPSVQRSPRILPPLPSGEVEISAPPPAPTRPNVSLVQVAVPLAFAVVGVVFSVLSGVSGNSGMMLLSFGFMGATGLAALHGWSRGRADYRREAAAREGDYRAYLAELQRDLTNQQTQQRDAELSVHPSPDDSCERVIRRDRTLWERRPTDSDFLALRAGRATAPFRVTVKAPRAQLGAAPDPLVAEARRLADEMLHVTECPLVVPLLEVGVLGVAAGREIGVEMVRCLVAQIATHHAPEDVRVACAFPESETSAWEWMRWLPHTWSPDGGRRHLAADAPSARAMLSELHASLRRGAASASGVARTAPTLVIVMARPDCLHGDPSASALLAEAKQLRVCSIVLGTALHDLPPQCGAVIEVVGADASYVVAGAQVDRRSFCADRFTRDRADALARSLAPSRSVGGTSTDIPATVHLLDLLGVTSVEQLGVAQRWSSAHAGASLAVPVGRGTGGRPFFIDLHERAHGPHGLGAGATGSGKSEFLRSLVMSLAVHFHPHEVAFVLVDYKGGGMSAEFQDLPHLVGVLTNLSGHLARRALVALRGELQRRQELLAQVGVQHADAYQDRVRSGTALTPMPHLIVIVDEFAELKRNEPEFMQELVSLARIGRSLGVHLILATQKPAGVVDEQIWSNARFRFCLRVERAEDSLEVLKRPDAAALPPRGRAFLQVGNNEVFEQFQSAWGGRAYDPAGTARAHGLVIAEVALDGTRRPLVTGTPTASTPSGVTELQALVRHLRAVADAEGIRRLPGPWLDPLPDTETLQALRGETGGWNGERWLPAVDWLNPPVGRLDDPARQQQPPYCVPLGREGSLIVYGAPGTGKTTFVHTLVASLAMSHTPAELNMYLMDFGGRSLKVFEGLPHVGGVVLESESEAIERLLGFLDRQLEMRKARFAEAGVSTLPAFRAATGEEMPGIVVVIDNYNALLSTYPDAQDAIIELTRDGSNLGLHLVVTATSPAAVYRIAGNCALAVALQLNDAGDYAATVGRTGGLQPDAIAGRGLVRGDPPLEMQTALAAAGTAEAERTHAVRRLVADLAVAWTGASAPPIPVLPHHVALHDILAPGDRWRALDDIDRTVPLGLRIDDLQPLAVSLSDGPHFLIAGAPQSGKTTLLRSWLLGLAERYTPDQLQMILVDLQREPLLPMRALPHVRSYVAGGDELALALSDLQTTLHERRRALDTARATCAGDLDAGLVLRSFPTLVVAMDDFDAIVAEIDAPTKSVLDDLIRRQRKIGLHVIATANAAELRLTWEDWAKALREGQTGFLVGSADHDDLALFNLRLPPGQAGQPVAAGTAFFARRGRSPIKLRVASATLGDISLAEWIDHLAHRPLASDADTEVL